MMNHTNWGGKRANSGRKAKLFNNQCNRTKVSRISLWDLGHIESGAYDRVLEILKTYREEMVEKNASRTSPRWLKMWALMDEIEEVLGCDYLSWSRPED
ncbi:hypothetical protein [Stanieria cyanosphaera]|nr:hypothetical protein [Stanieria cyanosphaera]